MKKIRLLRYLNHRLSNSKFLIGMNAHALRDWFRIRCRKTAPREIRDMAMLKLCKETALDLFEDDGHNCVRLCYCSENNIQRSDL